MFPTGVDAYAFWICMAIFAVIVGNLVYESLFRNWTDIFYVEPKCPCTNCKGLGKKGEDDE